MAAAQELLIDAFVARPAVPGGQMSGNHKAVVVNLLLVCAGLVAVKAVDALFRVGTHLVLMHYGILQARMAFGTFS
jgi:hypothetical protein